jgi:hypothetical protein
MQAFFQQPTEKRSAFIQNIQAIQATLHQKLIAKITSNKKSNGKTENKYPKSTSNMI